MPRPAAPRLLLPALRNAAAIVVATATLGGCASGGGSASGSAPAPKEAASASLCDTPPLDSTAFRRVERGGYTVGIPKAYSIAPGGGTDWAEFRSGARRVVLAQGNYPNLFQDGLRETVLRSSCTATIDGWPVEIVSINYVIEPSALTAPGPETGIHTVVGARWSHALGGRDLAIWIDTKDPAISRRLRGMFWTVHFKGDSTTGGAQD